MPLTAEGTIDLAVSEQALAGAAPLAHATKGLQRRLVNGINPDRAISLHCPLQLLRGTQRKAISDCSRNHGLPATGDGAAHGGSPSRLNTQSYPRTFIAIDPRNRCKLHNDDSTCRNARPLSPQRLAGERSQSGIQGEQDQLLQLRLGSQQTIEGVAVRQGLKTLLLQERPTG